MTALYGLRGEKKRVDYALELSDGNDSEFLAWLVELYPEATLPNQNLGDYWRDVLVTDERRERGET